MAITIDGDGTITGLSAGGLPNNSVQTADIADDQITLAKLAGGTDGQIITYDASGNPVAVGPGSDGQVLTSTGAGSPPAFENAPGGLFSSYALIEDRKSDETDGGTFTSGDWRKRDLNTEVADTDGIVSLSSNAFILGAGSYLIKWDAPAYRVDTHISRLMDITNTAVIGYGTSGMSDSSSGEVSTDFSPGAARVTPSGNTTYEIQHQCATTKSSSGLGLAANFGQEVYTRVEIYKEA